MVILGIDYGTRNFGLSIATGPLAEPLENLKVTPKIIENIREICQRLKVEKIVIGISEGAMAKQTEKFADEMKQRLSIPIVFHDETLSTQQAEAKLKESRGKRKKRRGPKHAFAATLILQDFLDQELQAN